MPHIKTTKNQAVFGGQFSIADQNAPFPGDLVISFAHGFQYLTDSKLSDNEKSELRSLLKKVFEEVCEREGYEFIHEE